MRNDLQTLLTEAPGSFRTLVLEADAEHDPPLLARAFEHSMPSMPALLESGAVARIGPRGSGEEGRSPETPFRHTWKVWWRRPCTWRDDIVWENGATVVNVVRDGTSSSYVSPQQTLYTNRRPTSLMARLRSAARRHAWTLPTVEAQLRMIPLLRPRFLASGWALEELERSEHAGRSVLRVRARSAGPPSESPPWDGLDEYEVLADVEHGVLLRLAGRFEGKEVAVVSVRAIRFDEPIPDEAFRHEPPEGTRVVWC